VGVKKRAGGEKKQAGGGGGGYSPISGILGCAAIKGMVFEPFWSENGYRFGTFWSEIGYGYRGNVHESL